MPRSPLARRLGRISLPLLAALAVAAALLPARGVLVAGPGATQYANEAYPMPPELKGVNLLAQTADQALAKSAGCVACHQGSHDPHYKDTLKLGCTDCHGGDPCATDKLKAHVAPRHPEAWATSANPVRSYTLLNHESPDFIRFVNPGDLRVAHISCGTTNCHGDVVLQSRMSMMTHGCMLWEAATYNNGGTPFKRARFGEAYSMNGTPLRIQTYPPPSEEELKRGVVPFLDPLPRFEVSQPGNILRIFERGGKARPEIGIPERLADPGRPLLDRLSIRGLGTENRTDPVMVGLQKTRLLDPTLNFLGTNDHPGDYRSSGCTACHVVYANDRSPVASGPFAWAGNQGRSHSVDPTIPKNESGHPIAHRFTVGMPTSQCMICHIHPGTTVMNSYLGFMWWDEETDGELLYPKKQKYPTAQEFTRAQMSNPNESAARTLYSDPAFLEKVYELNGEAKHTQFADFHGHGWVFRAVFKHDRKGRLLDHQGKVIEHATPEMLKAAVDMPVKLKEAYRCDRPAGTGTPAHPSVERDGVPVHLLDIHMEKGMHCIDCHFIQDVHGNTRLQMEVRAAVEIQCADCHGTAAKRPTLRTTGPASYTSSKEGGRDLTAMRTPFGKRRFERVGDKVYQNSMVEPNLRWEIVQVTDTLDPQHPHYNAKSRLAKTVRFDEAAGKLVWGDLPPNGEAGCAHQHKNMSCITCHSSWNPSCYGCHLPQKANKKMPQLHNEGDVTRNYTSYNFQTLRDEVYMLARDGDATGNRINPSRSSCAIHVTSYNQNRENIYTQQQTISGEGLSGIAFSTNVPHTVRGRGNVDNLPGRGETKSCTDCHLSKQEDNNAIMAQLLMHGTNYMNFIGRYCWVGAGEHGMFGVVVTEREEPQAVIGSTLHELAFPDFYEEHVERGRLLEHAHEHPGKDISEQLLRPFKEHEVLSLQARGEYLYAACGEGGLKVIDISMIDHKGFSERIFSAPVSPLGQRFYVKTKYATSVAAPTTIAPDPTRTHRPENKEAKVPAIYGSIFVTDKYEGLVVVGAGTLLDGNPLNNFLERQTTFNPNGLLCGAESITFVGTYGYVCCDAGLVILQLADPTKPEVKAVLGPNSGLSKPKQVQVQFRYGFCVDEDGLKVLDVTDLEKPQVVAKLELEEAHSVYVARTYAYIAGGPKGLIIVDVEKPLEPRIDQIYDADGCMTDVHDVKLGITYVSEFAYVADGRHGLRVVQLTSPETPGNMGFSPRPTPKLVATFKIPKEGHALTVAEGVDRDRAVDESGNQIAVFGRVGARPLNLEEQKKLYMKHGQVWRVSDDPNDPVFGPPRPFQRPQN